jgi:mRNA interferase RelE/StbE
MKKIWQISLGDSARKELRKLDKAAQKKIIKYLAEKIAPAEDPRQYGKALTAKFLGYWRYRVGDYRIICKIDDKEVVIHVFKLGHRKDIY